jgi:hypothetical protein
MNQLSHSREIGHRKRGSKRAGLGLAEADADADAGVWMGQPE